MAADRLDGLGQRVMDATGEAVPEGFSQWAKQAHDHAVLMNGRKTESRLPILVSTLIPQSLEAALVDHVVEVFTIRVEFEAPLADLALLDLDVNGGQIAAKDQDTDPSQIPPTKFTKVAARLPTHYRVIDYRILFHIGGLTNATGSN